MQARNLSTRSAHLSMDKNKDGKSVYFDGIICFGGQDWWYHNHGHADIQLMRQFSRQMPVLYVNSIGLRIPKMNEGRLFFKRIVRKLGSISRGLRIIQPDFGVFSAFTAPGLYQTFWGRRALSCQIKLQAKRMGIKNPLIWVVCPAAAEIIDHFDHAGLVYMRLDRYENYPGADFSQIRSYDKILKENADLTNFTSIELFEEGKDGCRRSSFIDHGVDYEIFSQAGIDHHEPDELKGILHPRIGFIGGIDGHSFNIELFLKVASRLCDHSFILVGDCSLPEGWCQLSNVHLLGKIAYERVAHYMAACDVLIIPWLSNLWVMACNPIKIKEYLATGRPIVSTFLPEIKKYGGLILIANDADGFVQRIQEALAGPIEASLLRERVRNETWKARSDEFLEQLYKLNIMPLYK